MLKIVTLVVAEPFNQNCRLLNCQGSNEAVIVDPGGDVAKIQSAVTFHGLTINQIWLTHSHIDHCGGVAGVRRFSEARLYAHNGEQHFRQSILDVCKMYAIPQGQMENCPEPDFEIDDGAKLKLGNFEFDVLFTPGHSPGHLCFYCRSEQALLAGDTLFSGAIGRSDLPGGNPETLNHSIREKLLVLDPATKVLSGHGPDTTIGHEIETNPYL